VIAGGQDLEHQGQHVGIEPRLKQGCGTRGRSFVIGTGFGFVENGGKCVELPYVDRH
jgi:hypothetical protein